MLRQLSYLCITLAACFISLPVAAAVIPFTGSTGALDKKTWYISHGWSNGDYQACEWRDDAVTLTDIGVAITLGPNRSGTLRPTSCGEIHTNDRTGYGTYSARIKAAAGSGLNTAFFTYIGPSVNGGEHSEVDFEFLGKNPRTVQLNYYDKGIAQGEKIIELGFDASADFHEYSFVWEPHKIRWYIDGKLVHETKPGANIPPNPGRIYLSLWAGAKSMNDWLGPFTYTAPATAEFSHIRFVPLHPQTTPIQ